MTTLSHKALVDLIFVEMQPYVGQTITHDLLEEVREHLSEALINSEVETLELGDDEGDL